MPYFASYHIDVRVTATAERVFDVLDDPARLGAHMSRRSAMTLGGRFEYRVEGDGRRVGSTIRLSGRVLGVVLDVVQQVTVYVRPHRKYWETVGEPRLGVIGAYRMGFEIHPVGQASHLRVSIQYALPQGPLPAPLRRFAAHRYARWCVRRIVAEAVLASDPTPP